jgi:uncharacterized membrane protein HdeD (DUF308 family)
MTYDPANDDPAPAHRYAAPPTVSELADHWGLVLFYGLVTLGLGITLAVWPGETLVVCAVLIAIQLLVSGVLRIVSALAASTLDGGVRALMGLSGALALIVGLLVLRDPLQTLLVVGIILGVWWVVSGVIDLVGAVVSPTPGRRAWDVVMSLVTILAGGFLLVNPDLSLGVLVFVVCAWLLITGVLAIVAAVLLRSARRTTTDATVTSANIRPAPSM